MDEPGGRGKGAEVGPQPSKQRRCWCEGGASKRWGLNAGDHMALLEGLKWRVSQITGRQWTIQSSGSNLSQFELPHVFPCIFQDFKVILLDFVSWHCRSDSLAGKINWSPTWPSIKEDVFVTYTVWFESLLYIFAKVGALVSQHHHSLSLDSPIRSEIFRQVLGYVSFARVSFFQCYKKPQSCLCKAVASCPI